MAEEQWVFSAFHPNSGIHIDRIRFCRRATKTIKQTRSTYETERTGSVHFRVKQNVRRENEYMNTHEINKKREN